ncbi:MAG: polysaccharide biosynthesis C-terminal domain-containing protein [Bacteroidota bacterium]
MSIKRLAGETAIYGISSILGRLLNFVILTPFLTRVFPAEEYGVISDLFFYTAFGIALLTFRMDTAVFRFASRPENDARQVYRKASRLGWGLVIFLVGGALLFAEQIADWVAYPDRAIYVRLVLLIIAFDVLAAVPLARLRLNNRPWTFALVNLANILVNIGLVFFFLYFADRQQANPAFSWFEQDSRLSYYFFAVLAASALRYVLLLLDNARQNWKAKFVDEPLLDSPSQRLTISYRQLFQYSAPLVIVALAGIVNGLIGPTMIKYWHGGTVSDNLFWAGQYGAAAKLAIFINLFVQAYNYAAEPFFFRQAGQNPEAADRQIYADAARTFLLLGSLAAAAILLLLPYVQLFIGKDAREGLIVLPFLLFANILLGLYYNFAISYKLTDRTRLGGIIAIIGSAIIILGDIWLIPQIGILGAAYAVLSCFLVMCVLAYLVSRRYFPIPYDLGRMTYYLIVTIVFIYIGLRFEWMAIRLLLLFVLPLVFWLTEKQWLKSLLKK